MPRQRRTRTELTPKQRVEIQLRINELIRQKKEAFAAEDLERALELMEEQHRLWESLHLLPNWQSVDWVILSNTDTED